MRKSSSGKFSGIKRPFKLEEIWRIRTRLEIENDLMQLALLNLVIDSKLRAIDLLKQGVIYDRVQCIQQKTGTDVHYEITPRTQQSISRWIFAASLEASSFLFPSSRRSGQPISYSFYRAIIRSWAVKLGLNADYYGTHSMRRTKATLIYARTKNIRAVQILLGHSKLDNTIRYLGVELEGALRLSEKTDC
ncbi:tyrosine-type recombinase/integrase [Vibrio parahaemolyticus]|uniref:tyrosine-type recombinase/integrase n=1 Tax=Vibrio parahaemolyticus TaxID=670 RepID=UPI0004F348B6|nr:tyrosine-type recombinase/integrase [Vibrio parahaemolyticus]ELB2958137.1 tyrosine-type recombinase/integrase [Vibrio parahaemolyticus]MBE3771245.1 tyrosine-type recombinase/integrase [Vibrio parahaemolyticus]MBE4296451.1 tyrosine-type recombinase/integrase [Vibrio parahaemolyticus]MBE4300958.1 tyrosine-type recombinase/integrase [Vibrio parahaemolyticus]MDF4727575.1 tyrosine-type recombinase/integrase [Vibrio parahaemolyticus]